MKFKKTPQSKRATYKLFDENGNFVTEYKPGVDGVTEVDIVMLHKMDDHEVYVNTKERKLLEWFQPVYDEWKERFIASFEKTHGRKPHSSEIPGGYRILESVDFMTENDEEEFGDKNRLQEKIAVTYEEDVSEAVLRLREIIHEMPETWQRVYELVLFNDISKTEAGRIIGISDVRVGQIVRQIIKKISEDKDLKKFF